MAEKVVIGNAELWHGDCREVLPMVQADAVVTDPPYGMGLNTDWSGMGGWYGKGKGIKHATIIGDDAPFNPAHLLRFSSRLVLWGAQYYCHALPERGGWLVFNKRGDGNTSKVAFGDCELAWTTEGQSVRLFSKMWHGVARWRWHREGGGQHPTQKPEDLMAWSIQHLKMPRSVCDPYMGTGATGVAAINLGLRFVGVEIHRPYFDEACRRIEDAQNKAASLLPPEKRPEPAQEWLPWDLPQK